jgi:hypothetical protein
MPTTADIAAGITPRITPVCFSLNSTTRQFENGELQIRGRKRRLVVWRKYELIQLLHFLLGVSYGFRSGADPGLNMFLLGNDEYQVLFLFLKWEATALAGKPRHNDGGIGRWAFPLL